MRLNSTAAAEDLAGPEVEDADADPLADFYNLWSQPFKPNLMNTVVFLVETAQIVAVLFVNYKGRPVRPHNTPLPPRPAALRELARLALSNAVGSSRVTLSLRSERSRAACQPR